MDRFLAIYLNDQLAMGVTWRELARRSRRANSGSELGEALAMVATDIAEDVTTFQDIMRRLRVRRNPVKAAFAAGAERLARLKLNGHLSTYSPLSRFEELEFLVMGIQGKKQLWDTLSRLAGLGARLPEVDFQHLIDRAEHQLSVLEPYRVQAGIDAFQHQAGPLRTP